MKKFWTIIFLTFTLFTVLAHDGEQHEENAHQDTINAERLVNDSHSIDTPEERTILNEEKKLTASLNDFPNLHPLMVHFPIVLLLIGAILAFVNVFFLKIEIDWVITGLVFFGALGAYLSGRTFHPHTHDLTLHAKQVLAQHDLWADWTIYLSIIGFVTQIISQFIFKQKRWAVVVVAFFLIVSGYSVSRAGHYGAQLVHIEAVGPQGNFLDLEESHSH
ncbi:hypothetical protein [uncultured Cyclobacterium sp.]|jgi:uncharacterized membrane protein|uniref:hypothetical protein n=1 Tax=uncultured Cyclobacterium sp. TaxID=453820 RepID=UPI0030EC6FA6|tara:strand:+ start:184 stop:840 length:657 start_codon:yes stop_codon:yes gene_type:complete